MVQFWNVEIGAVWIVEILSSGFQLPSTYLYIRLGNSQTVVRFLALVTMMVTTVDHGNHRSNDRGNDHSSTFPSFSYYDGNHG